MKMDDEEGVDVQEIDDDEDIYGDLESDIFLPPAKKPRVDDLEEYQTLKKENEGLKIKVKQLTKENNTYLRNISSLYGTARLEIDKKNFIIQNLTEKLKQVTKSKSNLTPDETEEIIKKCQEALHEAQAKITLGEIERSLAKVDPSKFGKRKHIKFGNMSLYFFREEGCFQRGDPVEFPKVDPVAAAVTGTEGSQANSQAEASHKKASGQSNHLEEKPKSSPTNTKVRPSPTKMSTRSQRTEDHHDVHKTSTNESKKCSAPGHDVEDKEQRTQRIYDKEPKLIEPDRRRHSNRIKSNDRQNNYNKRDRSREYSPPPYDRRNHKRDFEDKSSRSGSREHGGYKPENTRRQSSRNQESRLRQSRNRFLPDSDSKSKYSSSTNGKHRSRSKSK